MKRNVSLKKIAAAIVIALTASFFSIYAQDLKSGLVGYWPMELSPADFAGSNRGEPIGEEAYAEGRYGSAYYFGEGDNYVSLDSADSQKYAAASGFSWTMWIKIDDPPTSSLQGLGRIFFAMADQSTGEDATFGLGSSLGKKNSFAFQVDGDGGFGAMMQSPPSYKPAEGLDSTVWYFAAAVRDYENDLAVLYVDGVEVARKTFSRGPFDRNLVPAIGAFDDGASAQGFFKGLIDEVRVYDRALTESEIKAIYDLDPDRIEISEKSVDFGRTICKTDSTIDFTLTNNGNDDFTASEAGLRVGTNYSTNLESSFTLAAGETKNFELKFDPAEDGELRDTLYVFNDAASPPIVVPIVGENYTLNYEFVGVAGDTINFGRVCPGEFMDTTFTLSVEASYRSTFFGEITEPFVFLDSAIVASADTFDLVEDRPVRVGIPAFDEEQTFEAELRITDDCGVTRTIVLLADINIPKIVAEYEEEVDALICPETEFDNIMTFTNEDVKDLRLYLESSDPLFEVPAEILIDPLSDLEVPIKFLGTSVGGTYSTEVNVLGRCGYDTTFSMSLDVKDIRVRITPDTLDFGVVDLCGPDTTLAGEINLTNLNISDRDLHIIDILLDEGTWTNLEIGNPFPLNQTKTYDVEATFSEGGLQIKKISAVFDTCDLTRTIYIKADIRKIEAIAETLDFGKVIKDQTKDSSAYFFNSGTATITVESVEDNPPLFELLSTEPTLPRQLQPGDSIKMNFGFASVPGNQSYEALITVSTTCGEREFFADLLGEGVYQAKLTMSAPSIQAEPGEIIGIPINIVNPIELAEANVTKFKADVLVNPTLLIPQPPLSGGTLDGDYLRIPIESEIVPENRDMTIVELPFKAALGPRVRDSIFIENAEPVDGLAIIDMRAGEIEIDICREGGDRLFDATGKLKISSIGPNPASSLIKIDLELIEKGSINLYLANNLGQKVKTIDERKVDPGEYSYEISLEDLSGGAYFVILETPTQRLSRRIAVVK